ncbi:MAG: 1-phosphofructokinase family hexose kinase [Alphaproteobacteria bacterium]|nr:1-phosphofructokinase family hexose kinase [Alphaproteobacteria bacterium]
MKPIVTLTLNPSIDASSEADEVRPMRKNRISNEHFDPGGGGINVARVILELGADALPIYLAGGLTGQLLDKMIDGIGLPRMTIPIQGETRISHTVFERRTHKEYRFVPEGPEIADAEWRACLATLSDLDADYLVASGSLPQSVPTDFYARVARIAAERQMRFVLDTSGEPLEAALAEGVYLLKPNLRELRGLAGNKLGTLKEQHAAAMQIISSQQAELVAVSLGADGAFIADRHGCHDQAAPEVEMRSAVGAGDSFVAAMTLGLAQGRSHQDALRLAVATGTATVTTMGTALCRRRDVERLYDRLAETRSHFLSDRPTAGPID